MNRTVPRPAAEGVICVGGWIVLADGQGRGAVKNQSTGFIDLNSDLARPSEPVDEFAG